MTDLQQSLARLALAKLYNERINRAKRLVEDANRLFDQFDEMMKESERRRARYLVFRDYEPTTATMRLEKEDAIYKYIGAGWEEHSDKAHEVRLLAGSCLNAAKILQGDIDRYLAATKEW